MFAFSRIRAGEKITTPGYISAVEFYRLGEAKQRTALGRYSFRDLRRAGLQIIKVGETLTLTAES